MRFPSTDGKLAAFLHEKGDVREKRVADVLTRMRVKLHRRFLVALSDHDGVEVRVVKAPGELPRETP